jgi:hypothetical protein
MADYLRRGTHKARRVTARAMAASAYMIFPERLNWEDIFAELEQYERALYGLSLGVLQSASDQQLKDFVKTLDTMSGRFAPSGVTR